VLLVDQVALQLCTERFHVGEGTPHQAENSREIACLPRIWRSALRILW
jgi:hypothetical protein